jgi:hypothetical protein
MGRPREYKYSYREPRPHRDAAIIWALHQSKTPLNIDELVRRASKYLSEEPSEPLKKYLKADYLRMLVEHKKVVKVLEHNGEKQYALKDYANDEAKVFWAITDHLRGAWPSVKDIALDAGITPHLAEQLAYKLAPVTGWEPPEKGGEIPPTKFLHRLELAGWIKLGCRDTQFVRKRWTNNDINRAEEFLERYARYVPKIEAFRYLGEDKDSFHYTINWPEIPLELFVDSVMVLSADCRDFSGCGLEIEERRNPNEAN